MNLLQKIANFIKPFEGLALKAYKDIVGVWTIAYGYTKGVKKGDKIDLNIAEMYLFDEIKASVLTLNRLTIIPLSENQTIALTDFIYNLGAGAFQRSTLRMKLNRGDFEGAANQFIRWNKAKGIPLAGLTSRRIAERYLFLTRQADTK
jgi:lysozyme